MYLVARANTLCTPEPFSSRQLRKDQRSMHCGAVNKIDRRRVTKKSGKRRSLDLGLKATERIDLDLSSRALSLLLQDISGAYSCVQLVIEDQMTAAIQQVQTKNGYQNVNGCDVSTHRQPDTPLIYCRPALPSPLFGIENPCSFCHPGDPYVTSHRLRPIACCRCGLWRCCESCLTATRWLVRRPSPR